MEELLRSTAQEGDFIKQKANVWAFIWHLGKFHVKKKGNDGKKSHKKSHLLFDTNSEEDYTNVYKTNGQNICFFYFYFLVFMKFVKK